MICDGICIYEDVDFVGMYVVGVVVVKIFDDIVEYVFLG